LSKRRSNSELFIERHIEQGGIAPEDLGREEVDAVLGQIGGTMAGTNSRSMRG
jgi:hypothetical protein